jgi:adenosine deaminase
MRRGASAGLAAALAVASAIGPVHLRADEAGNAAATARRLAAVRQQPLLLEAFLREMPKGGDLHNHLSGSIYAESYIRWAVEDGLCLTTATLTLVGGACDAAAGRPPVTAVLQDSALYNATIDAWSMRNWPADRNGHDHFFTSFARFNSATINRLGDMLAEITARAASENISYVELMLTPDGGVATRLGREAGWNQDFAMMRSRLLGAGWGEVLTQTRQRLDAAESRRNELLRCGTPSPDPGCRVTVRYISQVLRAFPPEQVFAQMLAGFELAMAEPRVAGINLVQPEDDPVAVRDFSLQLSMLDFLHGLYPGVHIALHAGELVQGLVPPETLSFHVRDSVRRGHAVRIGHGTAIMHESDPVALLREMAAKRILVEVALTSADLILDVRGPAHPLAMFLRYGVPVALASDDLGVSRSNHTREWVKAVQEQALDYPTMKRLAQNSIDYAFADAAMKARLKQELSNAFRQFEQNQASMANARVAPRAAAP